MIGLLSTATRIKPAVLALPRLCLRLGDGVDVMASSGEGFELQVVGNDLGFVNE